MTGIKDYEYKDFNLWMINRVVAVGKFFADTLVAPEIAVPIQIAAAGTELAVEGWKSLPTDSPAFRGTYQDMLFEVTNVAWEKTFDKFERLDLSKKCREEMKGAFILWDKSKCVELVQKGKRPLGMVERGILAALRRWEEDKERKLQNKYFATEEQMVVTAREMTRTLFVNLKERIEEKPELKALLDREEIERLVNKVLQLQDRVIEDLKKLGIKIDDIDKTLELLKEESGNHGSKLDKLENILAKLLEYILEDRQDSKECKALFEEFRALIKMLLEEIKALREAQGREYKKTLEKKPAENLDSLVEKNSIRRLSDHLWVNWKTGVLATDFESALDRQTAYSGSPSSAASSSADGQSLKKLDRHQLRLLSILVQGEGAKVSWEELGERLRLATGKKDGGRRKTPHEEVIEGFGKRGDNPQDAVSRLCTSLNNVKQGVSDIIVPSEDGCRYVPMINSEDGKYLDLFAEYGFGKSDWDTLEKSIADNTKNAVIKKEDLPAWLRRHYNNVCFQFETQISNARGNSYNGGSVFGDYTMAQLYTNARVSVKGTEKTEVMLDFVEKWFDNELPNGMQGETRVIKKEKSSVKEKYGRVLVLHGQPGDGKTTFCKKAVYAHCKEGWLPEASQVLWLSLNPYDSNNEIVSGNLNKLALEKAFCLKRNPASKEETYFCRPAEFNHSLIIFDGYDELKGNLLTDPEAGTFRQFCEKVIALVSASPEYKLNAIITSRSMCIEEELRELEKSNIQGVTVAAFAELSEEQQDAMVDRMIQLDQERERDESEAIYEDDYYDEDDNDEDEERYREQSLKDYKEKILPELRKNDKLNDLLKNPSLFRMIVTRRFDDYEGVRNVAELYHNLVRDLLGYKQRGKDKKQKEKDRIDVLIDKYEGISAQIFVDDTETCVYDGKDDADEQELVYAFLTKNDEAEKGRLGFLHGSFRQYFFACHIISLIGRCEAERSEAVIADLLKLLGSRRIAESFVWQLISQVAELKQEQKGFSQAYIKNVLDGVEKIDDLARVMGEREWTPELRKHSTAEKNDMSAAENALFNLLGCVAAAEKGCLGLTGETDGRRIAAKKENRLPFGGSNGYANICAWLRRGDYSEIYLEGLNLSNCNLGSACLESAVLKGAWLAGEEMVLDGARLAGANMEHADLQKASLRGVRFSNMTNAGTASSNDATVKHANLRGAHLEDAHLERSVLSEVNLEKACLDRAHLEGASLEGANLDEAKIRNAYLIETDMKYASLKKVDFEKSHLECAGLEGANLQGGILNRTHMEEAVLRGTVLEEVELKGTHLEATKLGAAFLDGSNLEAAYLTEADLNGAFLTENMYNQLKDPRYHLLGLKPELPNKRIEVAGICREDGSLISGNRRAIDLSKDRDIEFGQYPHDDKDDIQPIRWRVLSRGYDKVLLITEELIDCHRYHDTDEPVTWEECSLRKWLNEEFLFKAFPDAADRDRIDLVCNQNPDNPEYGTKGGNPTWDRVFALSIEEVERYFPKGDDGRMATVTPYAGSPHDGLRGSYKDNEYQTSYGNGMGWWWLRSPGIRGNDAAYVSPDGDVYVDGDGVIDSPVSVRPALWLNL